MRSRIVELTRRGLRTAAARPRIRGALELTARELRRATAGDDGVRTSRLDAAEAAAPPTQTRSALNRLCRPDAWSDPAWAMFNRTLGLPDGAHRFHRKAFEWTQCVYGLEELHALGEGRRALGVAAGHECVLYYLANRCAEVVATDLYRGSFAGGPAQEADDAFLRDPARYAPFPFRTAALRGIPADALALPFADATFDVAFSLSSIEHFGGHEGSRAGVREIARVLRPGGVACISTEWILEGGEHPEFFTPRAFEDVVLGVPGLELIGDLDDTPPDPALIADPIWTSGEVEVTPHLVLGSGPFRWTSVVVFLRRT